MLQNQVGWQDNGSRTWRDMDREGQYNKRRGRRDGETHFRSCQVSRRGEGTEFVSFSRNIGSRNPHLHDRHRSGVTQGTSRIWRNNCHRSYHEHNSGSASSMAYGTGCGRGLGCGNRSHQDHPNGGSEWGSKKRRRRRREQGSNGHSSYTQGRSSSGTAGGDSAASSLEIPGFYYDPEKKRYFKIQSSNYVPKGDESIVTHESIAKKQAESQRQKDLSEFKAGTKLTGGTSSPTHRHSHRPSCHPFTTMLLHGYQRGDVSHSALEQSWILNSVSRLQQTGMHAVSDSLQEDLHVEHMLQMETNRDHDQLLCLWSLAGTTVQRLKLINLEPPKTASRALGVEFVSSPEMGDFQSWNKITSMCWSDFPQYLGHKFVLYTTMCHTGQVCSLAFIRCMEEEAPRGFEHLSYNLGQQAIWTCAWNYHKQRFGVGTEKGCVIIDCRTRQTWQYNTLKSDVLSQIFTKEDGGHVMYTGIRRGSILQHDLRKASGSPVGHSKMDHQSGICCLRMSSDETYLYASDFMGGIKKWDMRMQRVVLTYEGLFNRQCKVPFHIDEMHSLLYSAGQNCYTKIWCLRTGRLLLSIPPPYEASIYTIPAVRFSTHWGGLAGNMGLIMGANTNFYLYSLQTCEE